VKSENGKKIKIPQTPKPENNHRIKLKAILITLQYDP
jgi:hypothetical protein